MLWKLEGLDADQLSRPMVPAAPTSSAWSSTSPSVEYGWFCETFGRPTEPLPDVYADPEADMRLAPGETPGDVVAFYRRAWAAADAVIAELALDDTGTA